MPHCIMPRCVLRPRVPAARRRFRVALFLLVLGVPALAGAQATAGGLEGGQPLGPGVAVSMRYAERLDVPRATQPNESVRVELGSWRLSDTAREITVPHQGFYIAELRNGDVVTVIDGQQQLRHTGELWAVQPGQSMIVKTLNPRQQNTLLHIFAIRPAQ